VDVPVYTTAEYEGLLDDFRRRLEAIVSYAERVGALPILIVPPANDADFEPSRSFLDRATPRWQREAFRADFLAARQLAAADTASGIDRFRALLERQPSFAESHYRLAQLLARQGAHDEAYEHFIAARDLDGYPMRCLTSFQEAYRQVGARHECILIDGQSYFHKIGRDGLLGNELFQDVMHPSLRGQIALAQAVLGALHARRAFGWRPSSPVPTIDPHECAARFGIGRETWTAIAEWGVGFNAIVSRLRYEHSERKQRIEAFGAAKAKIEQGTAPEDVGWPNLGIPAAVPVVPYHSEGGALRQRLE
jgi:tetratricopeptide (TPR) repeat protein